MSGITYHLIADKDGQQTLTVFQDGGVPFVVQNDNPNWTQIVEGLADGSTAEELEELADLTTAVSKKFEPLSERVAVADGNVYFDGDLVDSAITRHIIRCLNTGDGSWKPLVQFLEKLATNPQEHSRNQLYSWLRGRDFAIAEDGDFIAYKGVAKQGNSLVSVRSGPAIVNGEAVNGQVPNDRGNIVEIARTSVAFDPEVGCASGLHVGDYDYASGWAQGALLKVKVNPRDVVSVPTDCDAAKVRVCRYTVVDTIDHEISEPILYDQDNDADYEDDYEADEAW